MDIRRPGAMAAFNVHSQINKESVAVTENSAVQNSGQVEAREEQSRVKDEKLFNFVFLLVLIV